MTCYASRLSPHEGSIRRQFAFIHLRVCKYKYDSSVKLSYTGIENVVIERMLCRHCNLACSGTLLDRDRFGEMEIPYQTPISFATARIHGGPDQSMSCADDQQCIVLSRTCPRTSPG